MTTKSSMPAAAAAAMLAGLMLLTQAASVSGDSRTHWPGRPSLVGTYGACWSKGTREQSSRASVRSASYATWSGPVSSLEKAETAIGG